MIEAKRTMARELQEEIKLEETRRMIARLEAFLDEIEENCDE
jgi:hypothetical protein